jgi:hypothetical protein
MEPSAPVAMTNAAVRASSPPSRLAISTAIGAATDFGASDMVITKPGQPGDRDAAHEAHERARNDVDNDSGQLLRQ